jgi:cyclohexadienyl dehydratase
MRWRIGQVLLAIGAGVILGAGDGARAGVLRVGTSGDYAPFSIAVGEEPVEYRGFDIDVANAYAADRGLQVEFVRFRWRDLIAGLESQRYDVAMSGITVRPERSAVATFSMPVTETGAVVLARPAERFDVLDDLDRRPVRIGVNAGGHLERVAMKRFSRAVLVAIPNNLAVRRALAEGSVDAAVTDTLEAPRWLEGLEDTALLGPFTRDRKAYLVRADLSPLAADLDAWLLEKERDGTLAGLREEHFGSAHSDRTPALTALLAAMDERLSLMPLVGIAKREQGLPLEVPEREGIVLDAAVQSAAAAAAHAGVRPLSEPAIRRLFQAQMDASKRIQWAAVQDLELERPQSPLDVQTVLRPALLRIGDRISRLAIALPPGLDAATVQTIARRELRTPHLPAASIDELAEAITALSAATTNAAADTPAAAP